MLLYLEQNAKSRNRDAAFPSQPHRRAFDRNLRPPTRPFIRVRAKRVKVSVFCAIILCNRETRTLLPFRRTNDTLALLGIMILTCRARISRGRYFEITEAGNRFAESRFPLFRDAYFPTRVCYTRT